MAHTKRHEDAKVRREHAGNKRVREAELDRRVRDRGSLMPEPSDRIVAGPWSGPRYGSGYPSRLHGGRR